jgi:hypothetical protein
VAQGSAYESDTRRRLSRPGNKRRTRIADAGSSIDALMVRALPEELDNIERIDRLTTVAETRRNAMLREIDRRRAVLSEALRRQVQEVEGEFQVIEKTPAATKSAA